MRRRRTVRPVAALLLLGATSACVTNSAGERGELRFGLDNDTFAKSDDDYTSGISGAYVSPPLESHREGSIPAWVADLYADLPGVGADGRQRFVSHGVNQRMFTPSDLTTAEPIPQDMPYSGLLYYTLTGGSQDENSMDAVSVNLGLVGPWALGEEIQSWVHEVIDSKDPEGWDNQIDNEPLVNVGYEHRGRLGAFGDRDGLGGDVLWSGAGSLGNLFTAATLGLAVRFGLRVPDDYAMPPPFFGDETIGSRAYSGPQEGWSIHGFAMANASLLGYSVIWDGNLFEDSQNVGYDPWIGRFYTGLAIAKGGLGLSAGLVWTTVPWENLEGREEQAYGRIGLALTL